MRGLLAVHMHDLTQLSDQALYVPQLLIHGARDMA